MDAGSPYPQQDESMVINFSDKILSETCISALSKGLSFVPTNHTNDFETIIDFQKFFRDLKLKEFFHSDMKDSPNRNMSLISLDQIHFPVSSVRDSAHCQFKKTSTFIAPKHRNAASLDTYWLLVENDKKKNIKSLIICQKRKEEL